MTRYTPECPFCGRMVNRPAEIKTEFGHVNSGVCECGAVYVCDPTGHNTGEAYAEALALAKGGWQITGMNENVDYETVDMEYDEKSHQRLYSKGLRSLSGRLVFVKLKVQQFKSSSPARTTPAAGDDRRRAITKEGKMNIKNRIQELLELRAYGQVADMAGQDKGVIRQLISLSYDKQDVISWRAIEAIGVISLTFSKDRMDILRDTVRRLLWSMGEESGGIGWSAAEMLGEIVTGDPDAFDDIIPILWSFKEEEMFRAGIVWAMERIAGIRPELVAFIIKDLPEMLEDRNPVVRGYTVRLIGLLQDALNAEDSRQQISKLSGDNSPVPVYIDGELLTRTVGEIAGEVLHKAVK
ncbi:MAG TPA: HEAT repeat domain-containing protein [Dissulfurispiraceae bacterium]|nr:HEAT repeat domain-containing protein [Dissulfurispiraceae bacterium]